MTKKNNSSNPNDDDNGKNTQPIDLFNKGPSLFNKNVQRRAKIIKDIKQSYKAGGEINLLIQELKYEKVKTINEYAKHHEQFIKLGPKFISKRIDLGIEMDVLKIRMGAIDMAVKAYQGHMDEVNDNIKDNEKNLRDCGFNPKTIVKEKVDPDNFSEYLKFHVKGLGLNMDNIKKAAREINNLSERSSSAIIQQLNTKRPMQSMSSSDVSSKKLGLN